MGRACDGVCASDVLDDPDAVSLEASETFEPFRDRGHSARLELVKPAAEK